MNKLIILYSSVDGHTHKICQYIADAISTTVTNRQVQLLALDAFAAQPDFADVDTIIIGASIRYGKHRPAVVDFLQQHHTTLAQRYTALFSVNLVARKPEKNTASTNPYMIKLLEQLDWQPHQVDVFAGKIDYARYRLLDKLMIKLIMYITNGPTSSPTPIEFTNWSRVDGFVGQLRQHLLSTAPAIV